MDVYILVFSYLLILLCDRWFLPFFGWVKGKDGKDGKRRKDGKDEKTERWSLNESPWGTK